MAASPSGSSTSPQRSDYSEIPPISATHAHRTLRVCGSCSDTNDVPSRNGRRRQDHRRRRRHGLRARPVQERAAVGGASRDDGRERERAAVADSHAEGAGRSRRARFAPAAGAGRRARARASRDRRVQGADRRVQRHHRERGRGSRAVGARHRRLHQRVQRGAAHRPGAGAAPVSRSAQSPHRVRASCWAFRSPTGWRIRSRRRSR